MTAHTNPAAFPRRSPLSLTRAKTTSLISVLCSSYYLAGKFGSFRARDQITPFSFWRKMLCWLLRPESKLQSNFPCYPGTLWNLGHSSCPCALLPASATLTWPPSAHSCFQTLTSYQLLTLKVSSLTSFSTYTKKAILSSPPPLPLSYPPGVFPPRHHSWNQLPLCPALHIFTRALIFLKAGSLLY